MIRIPIQKHSSCFEFDMRFEILEGLVTPTPIINLPTKTRSDTNNAWICCKCVNNSAFVKSGNVTGSFLDVNETSENSIYMNDESRWSSSAMVLDATDGILSLSACIVSSGTITVNKRVISTNPVTTTVI